ncbi:NF-Y protein [Tanacetum coccineum]
MFAVKKCHYPMHNKQGSVGSALAMVTQGYALVSHGDDRNPYVYVGNLDPVITEDELRQLFKRFGKGISVVEAILSDIMASKCLGYGCPSLKPYLHVSRHQHGMRRMSNSGGLFAKKTEAEKKSVSSRIKHVISEFTKSIHPPRNKWRNGEFLQ